MPHSHSVVSHKILSVPFLSPSCLIGCVPIIRPFLIDCRQTVVDSLHALNIGQTLERIFVSPPPPNSEPAIAMWQEIRCFSLSLLQKVLTRPGLVSAQCALSLLALVDHDDTTNTEESHHSQSGQDIFGIGHTSPDVSGLSRTTNFLLLSIYCQVKSRKVKYLTDAIDF